jgi:hypothetical protein
MDVRHLIMAFTAAGIAVSACAKSDIAAPSASAAAGDPAVILTESPASWRHDAFEFHRIRISGDVLEVVVQYGGGCARHDFAVLLYPVFMESEPVQMSGSLAHDAKGDPCRALIGSTLRFDLSPVKRAYREAYSTQRGVVHLNIAGWPERVVYAF